MYTLAANTCTILQPIRKAVLIVYLVAYVQKLLADNVNAYITYKLLLFVLYTYIVLNE